MKNVIRKKYLIMFIALFIAFIGKVNASTCSNDRIIELSSLASNVKVSYEAYDMEAVSYLDDEPSTRYIPSFNVAIFNLEDGLNAYVVRKDTNQKVVMTSEDVADDDVIYIDLGEAYKVKQVEVVIRSNDSNCQNEILKSTSLTIPMYNRFYNYQACEENPEFEMCQEFTTSDYSEVNDVDFGKKVTEYKEKKEEDEKRKTSLMYKISSFITKYKWVFIAVGIAIVAIVIIFIIRRKKSRLV